MDVGAGAALLDDRPDVAAAGTEYVLGEVARVDGVAVDDAEPIGTTIVAELEP